MILSTTLDEVLTNHGIKIKEKQRTIKLGEMKNIFIYASIAVAMVLCGCSTSEDVTDGHAPNTTLTADVENSAYTRTYLGNYNETDKNYDVLWEADDHIGVWDNNAWRDFTLYNGIGKTRADFSGYLSTAATTYKAFYPYSILSGSTAANQITLPASQAYRNEGTDHTTTQHVIAQNMWPAYSESTTTPLPFKNLCGAIRFNVKAANAEDVGTITGAKLIVSGTTMGLNGKFTVSGYPTPALAAAGDNTNTETLTGTESANLALTSTAFSSIFFVVPPQVYLSTTGAQTLELQVTVKRADNTTVVLCRFFPANKYALEVQRSHIAQLSLLLYKECELNFIKDVLYWGNDDTTNDGLIDAHGTDYVFNLNTILTPRITMHIQLPLGMVWANTSAGTVLSGDGLTTAQTVEITPSTTNVDIIVKMAPALRAAGTNTIQIYDAATTPTLLNELPIIWHNRLSYYAGSVNEGFTAAPTKVTGSDTGSRNGEGWTSVASNNTISYVTNAQDPEAGKDMYYVLKTNEAIYKGTVSNNKKIKLFMQQNELVFYLNGITYHDNGFYLDGTDGGTTRENVLFLPGSSRGVNTFTTRWAKDDSHVIYDVEPATGVVTRKPSLLTFDEFRTTTNSGVTFKDGNAYHGYRYGDPCSAVAPLYAYRFATYDEMAYVNTKSVRASNTQLKMTFAGVDYVMSGQGRRYMFYQSGSHTNTGNYQDDHAAFNGADVLIDMRYDGVKVFDPETSGYPGFVENALYAEYGVPVCVRN
jgi:hypothetical protein